MNHCFENVRLRRHKGLKEAVLKGLGRINVLSGPNSSGKTTVLECIADPKKCSIGQIYTAADQAALDEISMRNRTWNSQEDATWYRRAINEAFSSRDIWFRDDADALWDLISKIFSRSGRGGLSMKGEFLNAFNSTFADHPELILIPAKRKLEAHGKIEIPSNILANGQGVLSYLFYSKNQQSDSANRKTYDRILDGMATITKGHEFDIFLNESNTTELVFRSADSSWIKADDCGLGLRDLLIILYFAIASTNEVILIEEPENHLHPDIQRRLLRFLREKTTKQFIISTHSGVFLDYQLVDHIYGCKMTDEVRIEDSTSRAAMLSELGYSSADNLVSDLVILCEGPSDKSVLEVFLQKMASTGRFAVKVWPLGGDIMSQLDLSVFSQNYKVIALLDQDPGSAKVRRDFIKKCETANIPCHQLKRYSLENYFSISAIASVMKAQMPANITALDPAKRVSDQLGFEVKKIGWRIAQAMTLEDVKDTDFGKFLGKVEALLESKPAKT